MSAAIIASRELPRPQRGDFDAPKCCKSWLGRHLRRGKAAEGACETSP